MIIHLHLIPFEDVRYTVLELNAFIVPRYSSYICVPIPIPSLLCPSFAPYHHPFAYVPGKFASLHRI